MLESLRGFPSCMPSALKLASVLFIECAIIVGVGLLIARGIARVLDPSTTSRHFSAETKIKLHNVYLQNQPIANVLQKVTVHK